MEVALLSVMTTQAVFIFAMHMQACDSAVLPAADVCGVLEQWSHERPATARTLSSTPQRNIGGRSRSAAVLEPCEISLDCMNDIDV